MLTSIYRATGDLMKVKAVANHAQLSTTIGYVEGPKVETQNRARIASLQRVFVGHLEGTARGPPRRTYIRCDGRRSMPCRSGFSRRTF
jgi:hypothetical protein